MPAEAARGEPAGASPEQSRAPGDSGRCPKTPPAAPHGAVSAVPPAAPVSPGTGRHGEAGLRGSAGGRRQPGRCGDGRDTPSQGSATEMKGNIKLS